MEIDRQRICGRVGVKRRLASDTKAAAGGPTVRVPHAETKLAQYRYPCAGCSGRHRSPSHDRRRYHHGG